MSTNPDADRESGQTLQARGWARVANASHRVYNGSPGPGVNAALFDAIAYASTEARLGMRDLVQVAPSFARNPTLDVCRHGTTGGGVRASRHMTASIDHLPSAIAAETNCAHACSDAREPEADVTTPGRAGASGGASALRQPRRRSRWRYARVPRRSSSGGGVRRVHDATCVEWPWLARIPFVGVREGPSFTAGAPFA